MARTCCLNLRRSHTIPNESKFDQILGTEQRARPIRAVAIIGIVDGIVFSILNLFTVETVLLGLVELGVALLLFAPALAGPPNIAYLSLRIAAPIRLGRLSAGQKLEVGQVKEGADFAPLPLCVGVTQCHQFACVTGFKQQVAGQ